jgi:PEP-CTERM motif
LELAGSVSALSSASNRVDIVNNSSAAAGLLVSGTHKKVGDIDGSGTTQINAGGDLTADHIVQNALVIGGETGSPALVIIAASDAAGNSLFASSTSLFGSDPSSGGMALVTSLVPSSPFEADDISLCVASTDSTDLAVLAMGNTVGSNNPASVPEPSTLLLALLAVLGVLSTHFARRHFRCQTA